MSTSIQGRVLISVSLDTFADITDVPLTMPGGIDRDGLLFDGDLTTDQVAAIWWRMTSRDDADETKRRNLADLRTAASAADLTTPDGLEALRALLLAEADYLLGDA